MARSLTSVRVQMTLFATLQNTLDDSNVVSVNHPNLNFAPSITSGSYSANKADRGWQDLNRTLSSGASETLDLYDLGTLDVGAGAGNDGVGQSAVFEEIVAIAIKNENAVTADGQLEVIPAAANGWDPIGSHTVALGGALRGQGLLLKLQTADPAFVVTDASSHQITLTANGGDVTYSIYILARSDTESSSSSSVSTSSESSSPSSSSSSSSSSVSTSSSSSISTSSSQSSQSSVSTSSASSQSSSSQS